MGQGHSAGEFSNETVKKFQHEYEFEKELYDSRFGLIQIWKERVNPKNQVMISSKTFHSQLEYKEFSKELSDRSKFNHKNILRFIGWRRDISDGLCGVARKYDVYSQFCGQTLAKELKRRAEKRLYFTENELWYLAECTISVGAYLQERALFHGDFRPENVLLHENEEEGLVLIADNGLIGLYRNNYQLTLSHEDKGYLTPFLMNSFSAKETNPSYNVYNTDVYSLGMTLLYAASLNDPHSHFYDWNEKDIIERNILANLKDLEKQNYSHQLIELIRKMLNVDENARPDFLDLWPLGYIPATQPIYALPQSTIIQPIQPPVYQAPPVYYQQPLYVSQPYVVPQPQLNISQPVNFQPTSYVGSQIYSPSKNFPQTFNEERNKPTDLNELDRRVQEAIRNTEMTISRNAQYSPSKEDRKD